MTYRTPQGWLAAVAVLMLTILTSGVAYAEESSSALHQRIEAIDTDTPGNMGVYVKHLGSGEVVSYQAERTWYLASTVKVPLAIAVLQEVENGELSLNEELELARTDFVDGAGDLLWHSPGNRFTIETLLSKSITNSDSTATDILMRRLGVEAFNRRIRESMVADGFEPLTTILQVRYEAYAELHPSAENLSNMDYVEIRGAGGQEQRVRAFREKLDLAPQELNASDLGAAFERYYERDLNSATLTAFGTLLERLVRGDLLNSGHTRLVLGHMQNISTGDHRLLAGLPDDVQFAQKTGTQIARACNVGVIHPGKPGNAVVVASCMEDFGSISNAEQSFSRIAKALGQAGWL